MRHQTWNEKTDIFVAAHFRRLFVYVEVLRPNQPSGVISSTVSLPNHTFIGQA